MPAPDPRKPWQATLEVKKKRLQNLRQEARKITAEIKSIQYTIDNWTKVMKEGGDA